MTHNQFDVAKDEWVTTTEGSAGEIDVVVLLYKDEATVRLITQEVLALRESVSCLGFVILVDSNSPDDSGAIADEMSRTHPDTVRSVHAAKSGYAEALSLGFASSSAPWVAIVDGDREYPVSYLKDLVSLRDKYDIILTRRLSKPYSTFRIVLSAIYNKIVRLVFRVEFIDIGSGLKMYSRMSELLDRVESKSSFIAAELPIRAVHAGRAYVEVPITQLLNTHRPSGIVNVREIVQVCRDIAHVRWSLGWYRRDVVDPT